jgi:3-phosphoshikimate 1-carboxyvinyltransferase
MNLEIKARKLKGRVAIPPSKSDGQRALLSAAMSRGTSVIENLGFSDDESAMLKNIQVLGAKVARKTEENIAITGIASFPEIIDLNIGESGLGLRLLSGICATQKGTHKITGTGSVLKRDQSFFEQNLNKYGADVTSENGKLPLIFKGVINHNFIEVDGSKSSQYISGLLMGLALKKRYCKLNVRNLKSKPYVDMTIDTMAQFGVQVKNENYQTFELYADKSFSSTTYTVESDWSSASYWLVAAAVGAEVILEGLSLNSSQADIRFLDALQLAGCEVEEVKGGLKINANNLKAFNFDATDCPDLFPALLVLAAKCKGRTVLKGVLRLANKESDRGVVLQQEFGKLGVYIELCEDEMIIEGESILKRGVVSSNNDHRIAMSLAILGTTIDGGIEIEGAEAVSKSYPEFWEHLDLLSKG